MDASYCDACGSSRENTTGNDVLTSCLPSKINKNNGNSNADEEVVVVEPAQVTAGVWRKEDALQQQPLDIEIALESMAEEENVKKQRRHRVLNDKGVMCALWNSLLLGLRLLFLLVLTIYCYSRQREAGAELWLSVEVSCMYTVERTDVSCLQRMWK